MAEPRWCHSKMWRLIYVCNCSKLLNSAAPVLGAPSHPTRRPHSLLMIKWHPDLNPLRGGAEGGGSCGFWQLKVVG